MTSSGTAPELPPRAAARYRIIEALGSGAMGQVYRAVDRTTDHEVALKVLPPGADRQLWNRAAREVQALARIRSPHVVAVLDVESDTGRICFAMELLEGVSLRQRLQKGPLKAAEAVNLARQLARGLVAIHAAGLLHRDLKPENCMLLPDGRLVIVDLGLALDPTGAAERLTETGCFMGTLGYVPPEVVRGAQADGRSDVYQVGVILHELLTLRPPRPTDRYLRMAAGLDPFTVPPPSSFAPDCDPTLDGLVLAAIDLDPARRPPTAVELLRRLEAWGPPTAAALKAAAVPPTDRARHRPFPLRRTLAALVVVAALALVTWAGRRTPSEPERPATSIVPKPVPTLVDLVRGEKDAELARRLTAGEPPDFPGPDGLTALLVAAAVGDNSCTLRLLEAGADPDLRDADRQSALHLGARSGDVYLVRNLLRYGADFRLMDRNGDTPLHAALKAGQRAMALDMVAQGVDPYMKDSSGRTAQDLARELGDEGTARGLGMAGLGAAALNSSMPPLHRAVQRGDARVAAAIARRPRALLATEGHGRTALHIAARNDQAAFVDVLIGAGMAVDMRDDEGRTALHEAAERGFLPVVERLLSAGASPTATDADGTTPVEAARRRGHAEAAFIIRKAAAVAPPTPPR